MILSVSRPSVVRLLMVLGVFVVTLSLLHFQILDRVELMSYDLRCQVRGKQVTHPQMINVDITDDSITKIGRWPWDRKWHASLVKILKSLGARAIYFDVIFSEPSDPAQDKMLADAIHGMGRVYLAEYIDGFSTKKNMRLITPLPELMENARGLGHINLDPDFDGVMRRVPILISLDGKRIPQLAFSVALDEWGSSVNDVVIQDHQLVVHSKSRGDIHIPVDQQNNFMLNWPGKWKETYAHVSYLDLVGSYAQQKKGLSPKIPLEIFRDKFCLIGSSASALGDIKPTPFEPSYPAMGANLTVLSSLLEQKFITPFSSKQNLWLLLMLLPVMWLVMKIGSFFKTTLITFSLVVSYCVTAFVLFSYKGTWVPIVYPLAFILLAYFFMTLYNQVSIALERVKLFKMATRDSLTGLYNVGHFKLMLKAELDNLIMRPERKLSLMMGDVDHFKNTNDTYGHTTGDAVLKEVANVVKSNCRALDIPARYGGEEFILMLPGAGVEDAFRVAEKIRIALSQKTFTHEKGEFSKTISIGVTELSMRDKDRTLEDIVARADKGLYEAKESGRNKVVIVRDEPK